MVEHVVYKGPAKISTQPIKDKYVPDYEEGGVKYQGKYKIHQSGNNYETRDQHKKIYSAKIIQGTVTVPYTITRTEGTKFFCTKIIIDHDTPFTYLDIYDEIYNTNNAKLHHKPLGTVNPTRQSSQYDFVGVPLEFKGSIQLYQTGIWGVNNYCDISFYGWEE